LGRSCTFSSKVTFRNARTLRGATRLTVRVRFLGNAALLPRSATSTSLTVKTR
jgi:hypothetical protein